ncbi:MAG: SusF/SusE family outer membrane protein [Mediterranea sp.]|jgi:hypothetical protein|nr:SusF/SusE family outer membrane protein [Mediterranea sp.]
MRTYNIAALAAGIMALAACSDNGYMELDKGFTPLALTADATDLALNEAAHADNALQLSWTTGTNYGTGNRIAYTLELADAGSNFAAPYKVVDAATQTYSRTWTTEQLNNLVRENFGSGTLALEARVTAVVAGVDETQTATATLNITTYTPVTATLYLLGDAAPNGWNADNATEMTRKDNGLFTWTGNLAVGEFKLITTKGSFLPSYNKGADGKLTLRTDDSQPDDKFAIDEAYTYTVTANLLTGEITIAKSEGEQPRFDQVYFVGNPNGWGFTPMTRDALDPFLFRYGQFFATGKGGEFKFGTANGSWENMFKATVPNAPYTDASVSFVSGFDPDNKWYLQDGECEKAYKICLDTRDGKERMLMSEFIPYPMIYLVGDAAPAGWDLANATPMTAGSDAYTFTWTGALKAGELKFSADKQSDWNGAWFMPVTNGIAPAGTTEPMLFIDKSSDALKAQYLDTSIGDLDLKWKIADAGTYTITLNQLEETVTIAKQ